jgi:probable F420-dependent oxidoreductase
MATRVGLGLLGWPFASADGFWRFVDLCEEGGADSLWQSDQLVGETPSLECMSVMAALAGRTKRLKFGMSVLSLGWREPLIVAKACATIDVLSNGRLLPAFGLGSLATAEWAALGRDPQGAGQAFDEALELVSRLWRGETVDFDGVHVKAKGARISPLPVQTELPLWIGGSSPAAIRRTARFGTGWLGGVEGPEAAGRTVAAIKAALAETGRVIDEDHYGAGVFYRFGDPAEPIEALGRIPLSRIRESTVIGDAEAILAHIRAYEAGGATKLVARPLARGDEDVVDQTRRLIEQVLPRV